MHPQENTKPLFCPCGIIPAPSDSTVQQYAARRRDEEQLGCAFSVGSPRAAEKVLPEIVGAKLLARAQKRAV